MAERYSKDRKLEEVKREGKGRKIHGGQKEPGLIWVGFSFLTSLNNHGVDFSSSMRYCAH
jgi:hypothetical protein